jgi:transposase
MTHIRKFIVNLFRLKDIFVTDYQFKAKDKTLYLFLKPFKKGCRCPLCGRRCTIVHLSSSPRQWRDLPVCGWRVFFYYQPKEISCPTHGRLQEMIPWADPYARITYRFEYAMLMYCQWMTQKSASYLLHIPTSTLSDLLHQSIARSRDGHGIRELKSMGVDEISYCKGQKYATIVYDLDRSCVLWVGKGKGRETIDRFFQEALSKYQKSKILWAASDMSETYIGAIKEHCPNVTLVLDRFHIVKAVNGALDEVRKEQWREASKEERKILKGLRWLLFKRSSSRSIEDAKIIKTLQKGNRRIYRAWVLKDEFEHFWDFKSPSAAERFFNRWTTSALRSRLEPMRKLVKTFRKYSQEILSFIGNRLTNAKAEGINRVIKIVKNRASGFRTLQSFTDMIFLVVGDVDIPAQIPVRFHAI